MGAIDAEFAGSTRVLAVRAYRQQLLASNIANADTPNYKAVDIDFAKALAMAGSGDLAMTKTSAAHLDKAGGGGVFGIKPQYRNSVQPSIDGNTVDTNIEQAQFSENSLHYMTTLQFVSDKIKGVRSALGGA